MMTDLLVVEPHADQQVGWFALLLIGTFFLLLFYILHASLPFNTVQLPFESWAHVQSFVPEGWGFFTRDPKEPQLFYYRWKDGQWTSASVGPNGSVHNWLGLDRSARGQGVESSTMLAKVTHEQWADCDQAAEACLSENQKPLQMKATYPIPTLCGQVGFALQEPIPWAWSKSDEVITMPSKVLRVNVDCKQ